MQDKSVRSKLIYDMEKDIKEGFNFTREQAVQQYISKMKATDLALFCEFGKSVL